MLSDPNALKTVENEDRLLRRPPGAIEETRLAETCTSCTDCLCVCPVSVILLDRDGLPVLLSGQLCTNCGLCAEVCMTGAIELTEVTRAGLDRILQEERTSSIPTEQD